MIDQQTVACVKCKKTIESESNFCPHCGTKNIPVQKAEEQSFKTEKQFIESINSFDFNNPIECKKAWNESLKYLKCYPEGEYVLDIMLSTEILRGFLALNRISQVDELDYGLIDMELKDYRYNPSPLSAETITGFHNRPFSNIEFENLASKMGIEATLEQLDSVFETLDYLILHISRPKIDRIREEVTSKYQEKLIDGKSQAEINGISRTGLLERADNAYSLYIEEDLQGAAMGFEHMTHLDPLEPYNHHMLYEIYTKLGAHKKALEEILYAHSLDPFDTKIFYSLILTFRRLGLYFEAMQLYMWNEPEEVQKEGSQCSAIINDIIDERILISKLYFGLINNRISALLKNKNAWQDWCNLAIEFEKRKKGIFEKLETNLKGTSIFISYRRKDSGNHVDRLCDHLQNKIPNVQIYRDISSISIGDNWLIELENAIRKADVLIAVIGKDWAGIGKKKRKRRIDDSHDVLRREISLALRKNINILPILVDGAYMPNQEDLPKEMIGLAQIQALSFDKSIIDDIGVLYTKLLQILKPKAQAFRKSEETYTKIKKEKEPTIMAAFESDSKMGTNFNIVGLWECTLVGQDVKYIFRVKHDWSIEGIYETKVNNVFIQGRAGKLISNANKDSILGIRLEIITDSGEKLPYHIPIDQKLGDGYQGTNEEGVSHLLRLVDGTGSGL